MLQCPTKAFIGAKVVAAEIGGEIVLFHDPNYIQRVRLAPEFYD